MRTSLSTTASSSLVRLVAQTHTIEPQVGRLVEIRSWSAGTCEGALRFGVDHQAMIDAIKGPYVCLVDPADAKVFPQDAVEAYAATPADDPRRQPVCGIGGGATVTPRLAAGPIGVLDLAGGAAGLARGAKVSAASVAP